MSVVRAEFTKFRSVASTGWTLLSALVLVIGFGILYAMARVSRPPADPSAFDATAASLSGVQVAQIAVGVLGVLAVTGEYATGLIRTTFTAVPRRTPVLVGKAAVVAAGTFAVSLPAVFVAFLAGQSVLSPEDLDVSLAAPGVLRAVVGAALYLTVVALLGLALGALLRSTAGAIAALFGALFALQMAVGFLPDDVYRDVAKYLPAPAGQAVVNVDPDPYYLSPWAGLALFVLYTVVLLALATWRVRRRDV
jgi:ABC-type transport system involved in multi-copper enzyme maturation permease subunit